ncbi:MAG: flagellin FliC [Bacteriovoracaceae bacterium]|nr:flagellin FliC [Bacteriovoracaceae bacterium]
MSFRIASNVASVAAQRYTNNTLQEIDRSIRKMSSGERIVEARDDAAGLAISEKLKSYQRSYRAADRNTNQGISFVQVAEGGLSEVSNALNRLRELAIQAASDTYSDNERILIHEEYKQMQNEIQRIAEATQYGGTKLLAGGSGKFDFQVNIHNDDFQDRITFNPSDTDSTATTLGIANLDVLTKPGAQNSIHRIDQAISKLSGYRAKLGSYQNRLISTTNNLQTSDENISSANSRIRDLDFAMATTELATQRLREDASNAMLSQANNFGKNAIKLLE